MAKLEISVDWETPTVFAGEEIKCTITFKNTSRPTASPTASSLVDPNRSLTSARERWKLDLPPQQLSAGLPLSAGSRTGDGKPTGHRPTLSLNVPVKPSRSTLQGPRSASIGGNKQVPGKHKRSVSILSIGQQTSTSATNDTDRARVTVVEHVRNSHARTESFQGLPMRGGSLSMSPALSQEPDQAHEPGTVQSAGIPPSHLSSSLTNDTDTRRDELSPVETTSQPFATQTKSPAQGAAPVDPRRRASDTIGLGVQAAPKPRSSAANGPGVRRHRSQRASRATMGSTSGDASNPSLQRVMSDAGDSSPRSSMDIYSQSNDSSETLQSEYVAPTHPARPLMHRRQGSQLGRARPESETMMMGYVQLVGSFILEGSLVNLAPFEAIKRKAIIGGQGSGGVVGIESRRDNGLFGSLGWSSIGQSLGGLLGPEEPSSLREMKGSASSKAIPIISTAQSILFVDLQLRPGESKQFSYSHRLPRGIPPTFKGRAIKCNYHLVVATQRPQPSRAHQPGRPQHSVRQIEVPFKVQPAINDAGEIVGHDLMNPHIILKDISKTKMLDAANGKDQRPAALPSSSQGDGEFKAYVKELLDGSRNDSSVGLLSPTAAVPSTSAPSGLTTESKPSQIPARDLIEMAIARSATSGATRTSSNSLQISRGGEKVARVLLGRTAFRIGETVVGSVDFTGADVACFALNASLESAEIVDPAIALRSGASIHRATRRIHAQTSETTLGAERVSFALTIPPSATPEFLTTGVRLEWTLRLEFVTSDRRPGEEPADLLDVDDNDERGVFSSATRELSVQSFEVPVTLRVYGAIGGDSEPSSSTKGYRI